MPLCLPAKRSPCNPNIVPFAYFTGVGCGPVVVLGSLAAGRTIATQKPFRDLIKELLKTKNLS